MSALNFPGNERDIVNWARDGRYDLYLSHHILRETAGVLARKFDWSQDRIRSALYILLDSCTIIEPSLDMGHTLNHRADSLVLACAVEARADYLVTGDRKHLLPLQSYEGIDILSSAEFRLTIEGETRPEQ